MKNLNVNIFVFVGIVFLGLCQSNVMNALADNIDPITGQVEANRSCLQKDATGNCFEWKVLVDGQWMVERACKGPCSVRVERESDGATMIKSKQCDKDEICRARVPF